MQISLTLPLGVSDTLGDEKANILPTREELKKYIVPTVYHGRRQGSSPIRYFDREVPEAGRLNRGSHDE